MIVQCELCAVRFEDAYRSYVCPHDAFPANDGNNNFAVHNGAYRSMPTLDRAEWLDVWRMCYKIEEVAAVLCFRTASGSDMRRRIMLACRRAQETRRRLEQLWYPGWGDMHDFYVWANE